MGCAPPSSWSPLNIMVDWICVKGLRRVFVRRMLIKEHEHATSPAYYYTTPRANLPSSDMMTSNAADLESVANESVLSTPMIERRWNRTPSCPPRNLAIFLDEAE